MSPYERKVNPCISAAWQQSPESTYTLLFLYAYLLCQLCNVCITFMIIKPLTRNMSVLFRPVPANVFFAAAYSTMSSFVSATDQMSTINGIEMSFCAMSCLWIKYWYYWQQNAKNCKYVMCVKQIVVQKVMCCWWTEKWNQTVVNEYSTYQWYLPHWQSSPRSSLHTDAGLTAGVWAA